MGGLIFVFLMLSEQRNTETKGQYGSCLISVFSVLSVVKSCLPLSRPARSVPRIKNNAQHLSPLFFGVIPMLIRMVAVAVCCIVARPVLAQEPIPYGPSITLEQAKTLLTAAEAEAKKQKWPVAIAVMDPSGNLVAFQKLDNTQIGSIDIAQAKAKSAALFRRPTKAFEDLLAMGGANLRILKLPHAFPVEGGIPIILDGKVIGAVGVSGVKSSEDAQVAQAGIDALKPKP